MSTDVNSGAVPEEASVVRSVEQAHLRRERYPVETLRVVRTVETEMRTVEVPVRVERLRVERVPVDAAAAAPVMTATGPGRDLEVVLREEVPVVSMQVRAYERVQVSVREVVEQQVIDIDLRQEQVAVEVDQP
ncbi:DUF2382 domain-containing protein [Quadrisphaera sp. DSM 44207]|uniref:DUF2382 domain-containing protein n=1 Tax=Quadrisphaera sp. DSM 44207 TaxID=1881057 RepID=UPI00088A6DD7|nr:DUF2382 domain-containing protein [Quadrisphaera sp. DSM 44207]SDQ64175.1 protein of unknown function [Quadrisphaera sp. DSM 44207]